MRARAFSESEGVGIAINHGAGGDPEDVGSAWEHAAGSHDAERSSARVAGGEKRARKREKERKKETRSRFQMDLRLHLCRSTVRSTSSEVKPTVQSKPPTKIREQDDL